MEMNIVLPY